MGVGDTSDTTSRDFVSRFKHSVRREQKLPRNSKKRRKGKTRPNVATWSLLIRGDTPYTWGHLTPPYTSRTDLTLLSFVGVFTSSSFSLLPDSSKLVLLDHDYHHLCQNHPHNHHQHQHQHCHHFQTLLASFSDSAGIIFRLCWNHFQTRWNPTQIPEGKPVTRLRHSCRFFSVRQDLSLPNFIICVFFRFSIFIFIVWVEPHVASKSNQSSWKDQSV